MKSVIKSFLATGRPYVVAPEFVPASDGDRMQVDAVRDRDHIDALRDKGGKGKKGKGKGKGKTDESLKGAVCRWFA